MNALKAVAIAVVVLFAFTGCSRRVADLAIVSTQTPEYSMIAKSPMIQDVEGKDSRTWFIIFPLNGTPNFEEAIDAALVKANGDFMTNAKLYKTCWTVILFSGDKVKVVGDVGNSRGATLLKPQSE